MKVQIRGSRASWRALASVLTDIGLETVVDRAFEPFYWASRSWVVLPTRSPEALVHETCHWMVAAPAERQRDNFGLGSAGDPPSDGDGWTWRDEREAATCAAEWWIYRLAGRWIPSSPATPWLRRRLLGLEVGRSRRLEPTDRGREALGRAFSVLSEHRDLTERLVAGVSGRPRTRVQAPAARGRCDYQAALEAAGRGVLGVLAQGGPLDAVEIGLRAWPGEYVAGPRLRRVIEDLAQDGLIRLRAGGRWEIEALGLEVLENRGAGPGRQLDRDLVAGSGTKEGGGAARARPGRWPGPGKGAHRGRDGRAIGLEVWRTSPPGPAHGAPPALPIRPAPDLTGLSRPPRTRIPVLAADQDPGLRHRVLACYAEYGVPVNLEDPGDGPSWDGCRFRLGPQAAFALGATEWTSWACHELAHWRVADPRRRRLGNFGLGQAPRGGDPGFQEVDLDRADGEEERASALGILFELALGHDPGFTLDFHNWNDRFAFLDLASVHRALALEGILLDPVLSDLPSLASITHELEDAVHRYGGFRP